MDDNIGMRSDRRYEKIEFLGEGQVLLRHYNIIDNLTSISVNLNEWTFLCSLPQYSKQKTL